MLLLQVSFPFHDAEDDWIKVGLGLGNAAVLPSPQCSLSTKAKLVTVLQPEHLRRARVYDTHTKQWSLITPAQTWRDGEVEACSHCIKKALSHTVIMMGVAAALHCGQAPTALLHEECSAHIDCDLWLMRI